MENILLIHIGTGKTGTSAIQHFLYKNRTQLQQCGWDYPAIPSETCGKNINRDIMNGWMLAGTLNIALIERDIRHALCESFDTTQLDVQKIIDSTIKCIDNHLKHRNVILSSEMFWNLDPDILVSKFLKHFRHCKVVVYLRRQDRYMESLYNEAVKFKEHTSKRFQDMIQEWAFGSETQYLQKLLKLEHVREFDGELIVRPYEKQQFQGVYGDVISDFMNILHIHATKAEWKWPEDGSSNKSICNQLLEIKRVINEVISPEIMEHEITEYDRAIVSLGQYERDLGNGNYSGLITAEERVSFLQQFKHDNEEIANRFLPQNQGKLFFDMNMDIPVYTSQLTQMEETIIRVFTQVMYEQNKEIYQLISNVYMKNMIKIEMIPLDWRLCLYGAGILGKRCYSVLTHRSCNIVQWVDRDADRLKMINGMPITLPSQIQQNKVDYIVVAVSNRDVLGSIGKYLIEQNIPSDKVYRIIDESI